MSRSNGVAACAAGFVALCAAFVVSPTQASADDARATIVPAVQYSTAGSSRELQVQPVRHYWGGGWGGGGYGWGGPGLGIYLGGYRSEERRVGKECRL